MSCSCGGIGCKLCAGQKQEKIPKKPKFNNKKTEIDNIKFDSLAESRFYQQLKAWKASGRISDFTLQPKYLLQPEFTDNEDRKIKPIYYVADFEITHNDGSAETVDVKGMETKDFLIKAKMFKYYYSSKKLSIVAELPAKYGGGQGSFMLLSEIKKIRKEAAKNGQAPKAKKERKTTARKSKGSKGGNV